MIAKCVCDHAGQDKLHGKQNRVHNWAVNENSKSGGWRCTVCEKVKPHNLKEITK